MRKFLLEVFIGIVIAINLYGIIDSIFDYMVNEPAVEDTYTTVIYAE